MDPATISLLLKIGLPLLAADFALKGYKEVKGVGIQEKQMGLLQKQMQQKSKIGKMEAERYDKILKQILGLRKEETKKAQETELVQALEAGRTRQTGMIMAMLQALSSQSPTGFATRGGPSSSMVGLLR